MRAGANAGSFILGMMFLFIMAVHRLSVVVPAKAGTHFKSFGLGPRLRGADNLNIDRIASLRSQ